jgi:hypothetical protein
VGPAGGSSNAFGLGADSFSFSARG